MQTHSLQTAPNNGMLSIEWLLAALPLPLYLETSNISGLILSALSAGQEDYVHISIPYRKKEFIRNEYPDVFFF